MATTGLSDVGEEFVWKTAFRQDRINSRDTGIDVLLYNDSTDSLDDTSDLADISTEPNDGNYTRQTLTLDSTDLSLQVASGDIRVTGSVTFDVLNTTGSVDAWGVVVDVESDIVGSDTAQNPHLLASATFGTGSRDLTNYDSLTVNVNIDLN